MANSPNIASISTFSISEVVLFRNLDDWPMAEMLSATPPLADGNWSLALCESLEAGLDSTRRKIISSSNLP